MDNEKTENLRKAIAEYFDVAPEEIVTFIVGADSKAVDSETVGFSSVYWGLTSNWAIGNLRAIERHIEQEQNRAAMNAALSGITGDSDGNA